MDYPAALLPLNEHPLVLPRGNTVRILSSSLTLFPPRVRAKRTPAIRSADNPRGQPVVPELLILRMCEADRWRGVWVRDFGTKFHGPDGLPASLPVEHEAVLARIFSRTVSRLGFFPLVLWKGDDVLFATPTTGFRDRLRVAQLRWVDAALEEGFPPEALVMVHWRRLEPEG
jgi:hypothetical protein